MLIGTMNHPGRDLLKEIAWIGDMGFEFIDLTLEPPMASARSVNVEEVRRLLADHDLRVVGHTAFYLPLCSQFETIRKAAVEELKFCLEVFAELGASCMNLHPDANAPFCERRTVIEKNLQTIRDLQPVAAGFGICLMIENLPGNFNTARQLGELLEPVPELGLHLDIGHGNLLSDHNTTDELLRVYGHRLRHVHIHDNKGGTADLHLPLGAGSIDARHYVRALQSAGYDGTITLEVFTPDRQLLAYSRDVLRRLWREAEEEAQTVFTRAGRVATPSA